MLHIVKQSRPVALALAFVSAGALATMAAADQSLNPLRCEIRATPEGGRVSLQALAYADKNVNGIYSFHIESAGLNGDNSIEQGGAFSAAPGKPATLGAVTLNTEGTVYDARLEVTVDGKSIACAEQVGGAT